MCGAARFTLPTMPVEDYPRLPSMPTTAGTVDSATFATAVSQVAVAAGRDDTLPMLTGVRLEIDGPRITLAATDRYRLAVRELDWTPENPSAEPAQVLVPARTLSDAAKSLSHSSTMTLALSAGGAGEGIIGFAGSTNGRASRATTRLLDATFPAYRSLLPNEWSSTAEITVAPLVEAVRRVALVADRNTPVRLEFSPTGCRCRPAATTRDARRRTSRSASTASAITTAFNPQFLLDGLARAHRVHARGCCSPRRTSRWCCVRTPRRRERCRRVHVRDDAGPPAGLSRRSC